MTTFFKSNEEEQRGQKENDKKFSFLSCFEMPDGTF